MGVVVVVMVLGADPSLQALKELLLGLPPPPPVPALAFLLALGSSLAAQPAKPACPGGPVRGQGQLVLEKMTRHLSV